MNNSRKRTKIVATIGPASSDPEMIRNMLHAGMNVARINFSHGHEQDHIDAISNLRQIANEENIVLALLGDLQGPKIRMGEFETIYLNENDEVRFSFDGSVEGTLGLPHHELYKALTAGSKMIIGDGEMDLEVVSNDGTVLVCRSIYAGELKQRKGINTPGTTHAIPSITEKDKNDLRFICQFDLDFVALSFVRTADDINELRSLMAEQGKDIPIIAKIEKFEAIENLKAIAKTANGLMVARGDLGLDMPTEQLPILQKEIIRVANRYGIPVITATQMLASMETNPRPTRAEASDIANAILDGTDAIMLSNETAVGRHPILAIQTMANIAENTEANFPYKEWRQKRKSIAKLGNISDAISTSACNLAEQINAKLIVTSTMSGYTARQISRHRPVTMIYAVTPLARTRRQLALLWGVECVRMGNVESTDEMITESISAIESGDTQIHLEKGDLVVLTGGVPFGKTGHSNLIQVHEVKR
ncbi:MAG: pyruvate kinase [Cellvibrionaceae bacterium]|jgi:pyruvate kinase